MFSWTSLYLSKVKSCKSHPSTEPSTKAEKKENLQFILSERKPFKAHTGLGNTPSAWSRTHARTHTPLSLSLSHIYIESEVAKTVSGRSIPGAVGFIREHRRIGYISWKQWPTKTEKKRNRTKRKKWEKTDRWPRWRRSPRLWRVRRNLPRNPPRRRRTDVPGCSPCDASAWVSSATSSARRRPALLCRLWTEGRGLKLRRVARGTHNFRMIAWFPVYGVRHRCKGGDENVLATSYGTMGAGWTIMEMECSFDWSISFPASGLVLALNWIVDGWLSVFFLSIFGRLILLTSGKLARLQSLQFGWSLELVVEVVSKYVTGWDNYFMDLISREHFFSKRFNLQKEEYILMQFFSVTSFSEWLCNCFIIYNDRENYRSFVQRFFSSGGMFKLKYECFCTHGNVYRRFSSKGRQRAQRSFIIVTPYRYYL